MLLLNFAHPLAEGAFASNPGIDRRASSIPQGEIITFGRGGVLMPPSGAGQ